MPTPGGAGGSSGSGGGGPPPSGSSSSNPPAAGGGGGATGGGGTTAQVAGNYTVADLDGNLLQCSVKTDAQRRVRELQGMIRVMGQRRFEEMVRDLYFDADKLLEIGDRFMRPDGRLLSREHPLHSLTGAHAIMQIPAVANTDRLTQALQVNFQRYEFRHLSLASFLHPPMSPSWTSSATARGRREMASAVANLETFMVCFYHEGFAGVLGPLQTLLTTGVEQIPLTRFHDVYIWSEIQRTLAAWAGDLREQRISLGFPMVQMNTPEGAAALLTAYVRAMVDGADVDGLAHQREGRARSAEGRWSIMPHEEFYMEDGMHSRCKFPGIKQEKPEPPANPEHWGGTALEAVGKGAQQKPKSPKEAANAAKTE